MEDDQRFSLAFLGDFEMMVGLDYPTFQWGRGSSESGYGRLFATVTATS